MDQCRLSIAATGAFMHPLGDQTPIDCRYGETIDSLDLPHRRFVRVSAEMLLDYGGLRNPRAVVLWNVAGEGLQVIPTDEEAAAIAAKVLEVGLLGTVEPSADLASEVRTLGWQSIRPACPGQGLSGNTILWLAPGARVVLRPATPGVDILAKVLVLPGQ